MDRKILNIIKKNINNELEIYKIISITQYLFTYVNNTEEVVIVNSKTNQLIILSTKEVTTTR
jgi:hypothetical protein